MVEFTAGKNEEGMTAFKYAKNCFKSCPLGFIEKIFRVRDFKVNGKRVDKNFLLHENDLIQIYVTEEQIKASMRPDAMPKKKSTLQVIFEDDNLLICDKPQGLLVHGDKTEKKTTLMNDVLSYLNEKGEYSFRNNGGFVPSPAHRIDRNTSGLVVFGKNPEALKELEDLFMDKDAIHKYYTALVLGKTDGKGMIDKPLYKDEEASMVYVRSKEEGGKEAKTSYLAKEYFRKYTLVEACLLTGRTHQIRVHFSSIHHPLVGDPKYGIQDLNQDFRKRYGYTGQFLHASKLVFDEIGGKLSYLSGKEFISPMPEEEKRILSLLRKDK